MLTVLRRVRRSCGVVLGNNSSPTRSGEGDNRLGERQGFLEKGVRQ